MQINGIEITEEDFDNLVYLVEWKIGDLYEEMKDEYYENDPEELTSLKEEAESIDRIQTFLINLQRTTL